jgi:hypothetical protein
VGGFVDASRSSGASTGNEAALLVGVQAAGIGFVERCDLAAPDRETVRITKPIALRGAFRKMIDD